MSWLGKIAVGDDDEIYAALGEAGDPGGDGTRQPEAGRPDDLSAERLRECGDLVVVTDHADWKRGGSLDHSCRQLAGERGPLGWREHLHEAELRVMEGLDRDEDGPLRHSSFHVADARANAMTRQPKGGGT